jgi:hypothetical protein
MIKALTKLFALKFKKMNIPDFSTTLLVDQTPEQLFTAIKNVRGWWSEEIEGRTDILNEEFDYHFEDIHSCKMKIIEFIPEQKVVWLVKHSYFKPGLFNEAPQSSPANDRFSNNESEWTGTKIIFEISRKNDKTELRFTHQGLVAAFECFDVCVNGWTHYIRKSLFDLITTGKGQPNRTGTPMTSDEEKFHTAGNA